MWSTQCLLTPLDPNRGLSILKREFDHSNDQQARNGQVLEEDLNRSCCVYTRPLLSEDNAINGA